MDVTDAESIDAALKELIAKEGRIDVLIERDGKTYTVQGTSIER